MKFSVLRLLIIAALVAVFFATVRFIHDNVPPKTNDTALDHLCQSVMGAIVTYMMLTIIIVGIGGLSWLIEQAIRGFPVDEEAEEDDAEPLPRPAASEG